MSAEEVASPDGPRALRILQVGDMHFASRARPHLTAVLEDLLARERYDVVAFCGDFAQRARIGEFLCGAALVRHARRFGQTIAVPGNHDVAWWRSPMLVFGSEPILHKYRQWLHPETEPELSVPGLTLIGLNTAHGVAMHTLTRRLRDFSIIGGVTEKQLTRCSAALRRVPRGDLRAIVMHHNPVRGELSGRIGITNHQRVLTTLAAAGCELVLCGHDHQERVESVTVRDGSDGERRVVVSVCGTLCSRSRGARPGSVTEITVDRRQIALRILMEQPTSGTLEPTERFMFSRDT